MSKYKRGLLAISILFLLGGFIFWGWNSLLSEIIPWHKTSFKDYQEYKELLLENHCFGWSNFLEELPEGAVYEEYYWKRNWNTKCAAYSIQLSAEELERVAEARVSSYHEKWKDWANVQLYVCQEDERCYVEESRWFNEDLNFVKKVMQNPDESNQYYFGVAMKLEGPKGNRYSGVSLNETTNELVEFSFELPDEA